MKKLLIVSLLGFGATFAFSAAMQLNDSLAAGGSGKTLLAPTGGTAPVCDYVGSGETATIQLSKEVAGAAECDSSTAAVTTSAGKGKAKSYSATSEGGAIAETIEDNAGKYSDPTVARTKVMTTVDTQFNNAGAGS